MRKFKTVYRVFLAWQDEAEAEWLREMAQQGWFLHHYSFIAYTFERAEPQDYIYKLDYKATPNRDMDEYLQIYADAGWEHVASYLNWHYFRTPAKGAKVPDIYSDNASKIQKYKGLQRVLAVVLLSLSSIATTIVFNPGYNHPAMTFARGVYAGLLPLLALALYNVTRKIQKLRNQL